MPIPIALQLYSVRDDCAQDLFGTMAKVAAMGYDGVEFAGYHGHRAEDIRMILTDLGLRCAGTHAGFATLQDDQIDATIEFHGILSCENLVVPWLPEETRNSPAACLETANQLNAISAKLKPFAMRTGFHTHSGDMTPLSNGKCAWDLLGEYTTDDFIMQYDTANGMAGGADPVQPILDWPGRGRTVHLKEWSGEHGAKVIGEGMVPWQKVFDACERIAGTEWYIVEHEAYEGMSPLEAVDLCLKNLRAMGK
ncbi:MAG: sugar phosphate isomerase/epimerase [Chlorobia bacterium]|nr:sugar phosphate isomerase/epimerase [Fimbriimonadaceae bacterium]